MKVILLLHAAVFMNAGSYVIIPNSSAVTLIWRRSVARMVPSWIGISYCLPVRLSVMVSVSAIGGGALQIVLVRARRGWGVRGHTIFLAEPPTQVRHLAALAAERLPRGIDGPLAAIHAQTFPCAQPDHSIGSGGLGDFSCGSSPIGSAEIVRVVADVARGNHEDDVLGDVGGVVADAFEVAGDENQIQRGLNRVRV